MRLCPLSAPVTGPGTYSVLIAVVVVLAALACAGPATSIATSKTTEPQFASGLATPLSPQTPLPNIAAPPSASGATSPAPVKAIASKATPPLSGAYQTPSPSTAKRLGPPSNPPPSSPTPTPTASPLPTATPEPVPTLETGAVGIILAINGGSSSDRLRTVLTDSTSGEMVGTKYINLERKSKAVVLYLPDTGEVTVLDTYSSPSYAPFTERPYTIDDRIFIATKWHGGGNLSLEEYDPVTMRVIKRIAPQVDGEEGNFAVVGNRVFYRTESEYDPWRGRSTGGEIVRVSLEDGWDTTKLGRPDSYLRLKSSGNELYGAQLPTTKARATAIDRLDPMTAQVVERMVAFQVLNFDDYVPGSWTRVAVDNQVAYWVALAQRGPDLIGELIWYPLTSPNEDISSVEFKVPDGAGKIHSLLRFDVDDNLVLVWPRYQDAAGLYDDSQLILYDASTGVARLFDTDLRIFDAQVIHLGE